MIAIYAERSSRIAILRIQYDLQPEPTIPRLQPELVYARDLHMVFLAAYDEKFPSCYWTTIICNVFLGHAFLGLTWCWTSPGLPSSRGPGRHRRTILD